VSIYYLLCSGYCLWWATGKAISFWDSGSEFNVFMIFKTVSQNKT
jgi:hypothetical protein